MKKIVSLFLAMTMALSLAACGSKTGEQAAAGSGTQKEDTLVKEISSPVEIQFWHSISNPVHAGILENLIKEFNDTVGQEKGITVVPTFNGSSSGLYSNVIAAIKAGKRAGRDAGPPSLCGGLPPDRLCGGSGSLHQRPRCGHQQL